MDRLEVLGGLPHLQILDHRVVYPLLERDHHVVLLYGWRGSVLPPLRRQLSTERECNERETTSAHAVQSLKNDFARFSPNPLQPFRSELPKQCTNLDRRPALAQVQHTVVHEERPVLRRGRQGRVHLRVGRPELEYPGLHRALAREADLRPRPVALHRQTLFRRGEMADDETGHSVFLVLTSERAGRFFSRAVNYNVSPASGLTGIRQDDVRLHRPVDVGRAYHAERQPGLLPAGRGGRHPRGRGRPQQAGRHGGGLGLGYGPFSLRGGRPRNVVGSGRVQSHVEDSPDHNDDLAVVSVP